VTISCHFVLIYSRRRETTTTTNAGVRGRKRKDWLGIVLRWSVKISLQYENWVYMPMRLSLGITIVMMVIVVMLLSDLRAQ